LRKACTAALQQFLGDGIVLDFDFTTQSEGRTVSHARTDERKVLPEVKNIIAIASGKGGVGKSTVSSNLAVALAATGAKVGLIDADIFGPSQAKMFGLEGQVPDIQKINGRDRIIPIERFGVKIISISFFIKPEDATIWRGPMASSALKQFITDGLWGDLDYLLIDLPPGTSDIHLTVVQEMPVTGALIVTTPQDVAVADAIKGVGMFRSKQINVPILGVVENMSWFTPEELPDNRYFIFGSGGGQKLADKFEVPLLAQIPIVQGIREGGDSGNPIAVDGHEIVKAQFAALAEVLADKIELRNAALAPTQKVEITNHDGCASTKK
jgi:ATP-binding protein involved in chromosome partitioning